MLSVAPKARALSVARTGRRSIARDNALGLASPREFSPERAVLNRHRTGASTTAGAKLPGRSNEAAERLETRRQRQAVVRKDHGEAKAVLENGRRARLRAARHCG